MLQPPLATRLLVAQLTDFGSETCRFISMPNSTSRVPNIAKCVVLSINMIEAPLGNTTTIGEEMAA